MFLTLKVPKKLTNMKIIKKSLKMLSSLTILILSVILIKLVSDYTLPIEYSNLIQKYSIEYGVKEELIYSVINAESRFRETATSNKNAMGLMQILPDTGLWLAENLGLENITENDLYNPETNIKLGTYYLSYLLERFENEKNALASYNAGATNVARWLENEDYSENGNLYNIPFNETSKYVKKISFFKIGYSIKISILKFLNLY